MSTGTAEPHVAAIDDLGFDRPTTLGLKTLAAFAMAALTGLAAQVAVPLPFTPVPITGQTFAVLLAGVALGARWGGVSQGLYAAVGAAGVPWFAGGTGGLAAAAATGGYLLGFVVAAVVVGALVHRFAPARRFLPLAALLVAVNFAVVHVLGLLWLAAFLQLTTGGIGTLPAFLAANFLPFALGDVLKAVLAAGVGAAIAPAAGSDRGDTTPGPNA